MNTLSAPRARDLLRECLRVRLVEYRIVELYPSDLIQSPVHLSVGQEAVAVGVCASLMDADKVFINYRGHAFYLARGGCLKAFFSELMGRQDGICRGKGGSMHLASPAQGLMGASAVVGSTISHAVGYALGLKLAGSESVSVSVCGDGAMEQGVFFESLNFASLKRVPVLFLIEDNGLAVHSSAGERQAFDLESLCAAFKCPFFEVEGIDPSVVKEISDVALQVCRSSGGPAVLRVKCCRYLEHVGVGEDFDAGYRSSSDIDGWKMRDPILDPLLIADFESEINSEIDKAVEFAINSPVSPKASLLEDII
ncbi:thiamine pyrophosphate-dependent dehydrogenase E1 component subunit alpha [Litoricolaceae bacterium]|nr:thiamine pyrophosphate-dependent dehydrogenase E1 component subunit alpha [Litorivicinaceae bacterium]